MNSCFFFTLILLLRLQTNVTMVSIITSYLHILHGSKAAHRDGVEAQYIPDIRSSSLSEHSVLTYTGLCSHPGSASLQCFGKHLSK